jgi:hypothetical protein
LILFFRQFGRQVERFEHLEASLRRPRSQQGQPCESIVKARSFATSGVPSTNSSVILRRNAETLCYTAAQRVPGSRSMNQTMPPRPEIKLEVYNGPLDLLLALIEQQRLEITVVSLARVAEQ